MDPRLRTPALRGDLAAVNRALDEGADPNLADADGYVISVLLAAGADPTQQRKSDGYQWSPLVRAVLYAEFAEITSLAPLLLRAGASINQPLITLIFQTLNDPVRFLRDCGPIVGNLTPRKRKVIEYLRAVHAAGGFPVYARAHRSRFAAIVSRGTRLPSDVIPTIVDYWAHPGWYKYTQ